MPFSTDRSETSMIARSERIARIWSRLPVRFRRGMLAMTAIMLLGFSAAWSQVPPPNRPSASSVSAVTNRVTARPKQDRLREGTELQEAQGYFRFVDDRVVFFRANGDARYIGLENLNLERIVSEITNNPTQLEWTVVGSITEFRGANYLLVRRAVLSRSTSDFKSSKTMQGGK